MLDLRSIAAALGGEVSGGRVRAPGPGHSLKDRSLSVKLNDAGDDIVIKSFAGDDWALCKEYVRQRCGLPSWESGQSNGKDRECASMIPAPPRKIIAEYIYLTANAQPYLKVQKATAHPRFLQLHWTGSAWQYGKPKGNPVPYRLPALLAAHISKTVYIVEGEKDADTLVGLGLVATTCPEGAGKWRECLNQYFAGRHVVVLPDNDEPGAKHGEQVASHLHGIAASVRILELPGLAEKQDASDWIAHGNTIETLTALAAETPLWTPPSPNNLSPIPDKFSKAIADALASVGTAAQLQTMIFPPLKYIVPGLIVEGCVLLAGKPKAGKSLFALDVALAITADRYCLGDKKCEQGDVLYLALEDRKPRLQRRLTKLLPTFHGKWPERFHYVVQGQWPRADQGGLEAIDRWCEEHPNARLVVVDVWAAFRAPTIGKNAYAEDYGPLSKLQELAGQRSITILVLHHTRKGASEDPVEEISGTLGLAGATDAFLVLKRSGSTGTLVGRGRDAEDVDLAVQFSKETLRWTILGSAEEVQQSEQRTRILAVLLDADEPLSPKDIASLIRQRGDATRQLLSKMHKAGQVVRAKKYGRYMLPGHTDHSHASGAQDTDFSEENCSVTGVTAA
jgi:hypothetical protein